MRFHCLGIQHTITSKEYVACAFTQKVLKFCSMMTQRGHTVFHYGHEDSEVECTEHVNVLSRDKYREVYGTHDFRSKLFKFDQNDDAYKEFNANAVREINSRKQNGDWLLAFWGAGHYPICKEAGENMKVCEPGIGYPYGHFAEYKIFESYAMYHSFTGIPRVAQCSDIDDIWSKETVIPNYFDLKDFEFSEKKDDYFLFLGRIGTAKGVHMAIRMTEAIGKKLIIGGQNAEGGLKEVGMWPVPSHVEVLGHMDVEQKKRYMSRAKAVVCMSTFTEPFCGVHVEAMLCGTPVITSDWGAMTEFNIHGVTGFRCRTLREMIDAAQQIDRISPKTCREWAVNKFSLERIAPMYEKFFNIEEPQLQSIMKVAVWTETIWAIGRISRAIQKYIRNAQVDIYDWSDGEKNRVLFREKWRDYDYIITKSDVFKLKELFGIELPCDILPKLIVISHSPNLEHPYFREHIEVYDDPLYAGVSRETCEALTKIGIKNPQWFPFGADTDIFKNNHKIQNPIRRIGFICVKNHSHPQYRQVKRPDIFEEICRRVQAEPVYIYNRLTEDASLYANIDLLVSCSEFESGPLGIFEAAACGVPVLIKPTGNAQYIKGIRIFSTVEQAVECINHWNNNLDELRVYRDAVTHDVRSEWSMKKCIETFLEPCLRLDIRNVPVTNSLQTTLRPPYIYMENTCSRTPWYTPYVKVPKDADAVYLGISEWSLSPVNTYGTRKTMRYSEYSRDIVRVYNMLSAHAVLVLSDAWKNALCKSKEPIDEMTYRNIYALREPIYYQDPSKNGQDGTLVTFNSIPNTRVAVWIESNWAFGRYAKAIKKYLGQPVDIYDWANVDHNKKLWFDGLWKQYDTIISNTTLLRLKTLYNIDPTEDMTRRFLVISFFPVFEGTGYFQETLKNFPRNARYAGASKEICKVMENLGIHDVKYTPFTADLDIFRPKHVISGHIKRLGIIGGPSRTQHEDYQKNKGIEMFDVICKSGGYTGVYIHGRSGDDIYNDIDALICCSQYEGAPTGIFEAGSIGIPVLTRAVGCAQEIKGIKIFDTPEDAVEILDYWNSHIDKLIDYTDSVTREIRTHWGLETCIQKYLTEVVSV